ncbi:MAG: hypothetical protein M1831_006054 [Alyxoria varia]|nr:MAG: hypothetical protein M1831_006054 [Alyxoria varia]
MFPSTPTGVVGFGTRLSEDEYAKVAGVEAKKEPTEGDLRRSLSRRASSRISRGVSLRRKPTADTTRTQTTADTTRSNLIIDTNVTNEPNEIYEQVDYSSSEGDSIDWDEYVAENTFVPNRENFLTDWNYIPDEELPPMLNILKGPQTLHLEDAPPKEKKPKTQVKGKGKKSGENDEGGADEDYSRQSDNGEESESNYDSDSSSGLPSLRAAEGEDDSNARFSWNVDVNPNVKPWAHKDPYEPAFMKRIRNHYDQESAEFDATDEDEGSGHTKADKSEADDEGSQATSDSPVTQIADSEDTGDAEFPDDASDSGAVSFFENSSSEEDEETNEAEGEEEPYTDFELDYFLGHVERTSDREYEVEERRFKTLEDAALRLQAESKGYLDSLRAMTASQMRIAETIDAFYGDSGARDGVSRSYKQAVEDLDAETIKALDGPFRQTVLDPIGKFCGYFPEINECIKKRNHKMLDYDRLRANAKRLTEKPDKDPQKLPLAQKEADAAKTHFEQLNLQLSEEIPQLIDLRVPYLDPSFEALVKIQLRFCAEAYSRMAQVQQWLDEDTRELYAQGSLDEEVERTLQEIRDLSISGTI